MYIHQRYLLTAIYSWVSPAQKYGINVQCGQYNGMIWNLLFKFPLVVHCNEILEKVISLYFFFLSSKQRYPSTYITSMMWILITQIECLVIAFYCNVIATSLVLHIYWLWVAWCWEKLKAEGEVNDRGRDGWLASLTQETWVWANSRRWWRTEKPGMLQSTGSQRVGHNWATEQQQVVSGSGGKLWLKLKWWSGRTFWR